MSFVRDKNTGAIINTDESYYQAVLAQRSSQKKLEEMADKYKSLEDKLDAICRNLETFKQER